MLQLKQMREANEELIAPLKLSALSAPHEALRRAHSSVSLQLRSGASDARKAWFEAVLAEDERNERLERDEEAKGKKSAKALPMRRTRSFKY